MKYLTTIGLEVHVQLKTRSKMFCGCPVEFGAPPNTHTCPTCLGLPGALPTMNHEALRMTVLTGLMLDCDIAATCKFDRKNYFYPDMPKNYQISQYDMPLCQNGAVSLHDLAYPKDAQKTIATPDKQVHLVRIHLEEDVGKSFHFELSTGIDFNRAGTPLMEIVTQPEIASPEQAFAFLTSLNQILSYGGVSDADMEKGQLRCDCNVSVRPETQAEFGAKIEIKNMNSISGVRRALAYEIVRQTAALENGEILRQETRGWNDAAGETFLMRTKESAHDYRYFPEPDLVPVKSEALLADARSRMPELPKQKRQKIVDSYGITPYIAAVLVDEKPRVEFFENTVVYVKGVEARGEVGLPKVVANWVVNDLQNALNKAAKPITESPVSPEHLAELVKIIDSGNISGKQAKDVFGEMFASGKGPAAIVREKGIEQLSDTGAVEKICDEVIAANPKPAADFKAGNEASLNFLKGQVMKLSKGKANPQVVGEILARKLRG